MRVCIDITEMHKVDFVSGIQRVVIEVTTRWIRDGKNVLLFVYDSQRTCFVEVDNYKYLEFYLGETSAKDYLKKDNTWNIADFGETDIFFDMDSVWMNSNKRSYLLQKLKENGCKIAAHIYDIIPVTHAQYCHEFTTLSFLEYIGAQLQYADLIISNAQATLDAIAELIKGTGVPAVKSAVVSLGSDIKKTGKKQIIRGKVEEIPQKGKYVLMVGTIEPRKNHKYVLRAFEEALFKEGVNLVFAGRIGWNVEDFIEYVKHHEELGKKLFFATDLSDAEITFLYENAMVVAFPSYNEGFGLPIIEAFNRGVPVVATDIPVLREVGREYCRYFSLEDTKSFVDIIRVYVNNPQVYMEEKEKIKEYKRYTWKECAEKMYGELEKI